MSITFGLQRQAKASNIDTVIASGMSFTPQNLTIQVGDSFVFINQGGTHNVNGTTATFPNNPASFGNGSPAAAPWTYGFRFTVAGQYDYRCDVHYASGMVGTIDVQDTATSGIVSHSKGIIKIWPNPAHDKIIIKSNREIKAISIFNILGKKVKTIKGFRGRTIDISPLPEGFYFIKLQTKDWIIYHKIIKE